MRKFRCPPGANIFGRRGRIEILKAQGVISATVGEGNTNQHNCHKIHEPGLCMKPTVGSWEVRKRFQEPPGASIFRPRPG